MSNHLSKKRNVAGKWSERLIFSRDLHICLMYSVDALVCFLHCGQWYFSVKLRSVAYVLMWLSGGRGSTMSLDRYGDLSYSPTRDKKRWVRGGRDPGVSKSLDSERIISQECRQSSIRKLHCLLEVVFIVLIYVPVLLVLISSFGMTFCHGLGFRE